MGSEVLPGDKEAKDVIASLRAAVQEANDGQDSSGNVSNNGTKNVSSAKTKSEIQKLKKTLNKVATKLWCYHLCR